MSKVADAVKEIEAQLVELAPEHEGLRDFARLNLEAESAAAVAAQIIVYDRRVGLLTSTLAWLKALAEDGHPAIAAAEIPHSALLDLSRNAETLRAALDTFSSARAVGLGLGTKPAEQKP